MSRKRNRPPNLDGPRNGKDLEQGPVTKDCPHCGGDGWTLTGYTGGRDICSWCMGTGRVRLGDGKPIKVRGR